MKRLIALLAVLVTFAIVPPGTSRANWVMTPSSIDTERIQSGGPPMDGIPAIMEPRFLAAAEAGFLAGDDMVLGLSVNGDARAYPLRILSWHELVNDTVGETPVLVSW
jgi:hypothetical protein